MMWKRIYLLGCFSVFLIGLEAQNPIILKRGGVDSQECMEWVDARMKKMTLKQKIGQLGIPTVALQNTAANRKNIQRAV